MPKSKSLLFVLFPLVAACTTPQTVDLLGRPEQPEPVLLSIITPADIDNCAVGCPSGGGKATIVREAYTLNNNGSTKFANWVAYKITKDTPFPNRPRNWKTDPDVPAGDTLDPVDYNGAYKAMDLDRGHQANLASMAGVAEWEPLNYLSNITPQKEDLNRGAWARLENQERALGKTKGVDTLYVATGPLYEKDIGQLRRKESGTCRGDQ